MQRSSLPLRNRVHGELTALLGPGGSLHRPPSSLASFLADDVLLADVADQYRRSQPDGALGGLAVVVTAGPPGAGKSRAVASLSARHRRIDSDDVKDLLLARAEKEGLLADRGAHRLADDRIVRPAELAGWVHRASTDVADLVRAESLALGENIIVEGTLGWPDLIDIYATELADSDYAKLTVLSVEVPQAVAIKQARARWWSGRLIASGLGGRFLPDAALGPFFPTAAVSICVARARELYRAGLDAGVETQLALVSRDAHGTERNALITPDGEVETWPGGSHRSSTSRLGAICIRCGRPLTSAGSVARGMGQECANR